jgi:hypothetical protein
MPRWGERLDQLEWLLCEDRDPGDDEPCVNCRLVPRDSHAATRATAAQGMARPNWTGGRPPGYVADGR